MPIIYLFGHIPTRRLTGGAHLIIHVRKNKPVLVNVHALGGWNMMSTRLIRTGFV